MATCNNCGATVSDDAKFCTECGKMIEKKSVCVNCGAKLRDGAKFCVECGTPIPKQEPQKETVLQKDIVEVNENLLSSLNNLNDTFEEFLELQRENPDVLFTIVLDDDMKLVGWITSFNITKGLREGKKLISEVMDPVENILVIKEDEAAKNTVIEISKHKLISVPIINDDNQVTGVCRSVDVVDSMSSLYDIKVVKIYEAMEKELRGVTWDELMEASAKISTRTTGVKITAEEYEKNIQNSTFGEAIWATGGLEKFFAGLISVGEIVIARKVGRARR